MDPYEQYLADIAYEDYLNQIQQEDLNSAMSRGTPNQVGANYDRSVIGNIAEGITETPRALYQTGQDIYGFATSPIETLQRAGPEKTARTVGGLAAGTAGAGTFAPIGAAWGATLGPIGAAAGGLLGGAAGFGAGLLGFDVAADAVSDQLRPADQYLKDFAYNTTQGVVTGAPFAAASGIKGALGKGARSFGQEGADLRVANKLREIDPTITPEAIDTALQGQSPGNPFNQYVSLSELLDSPGLKNAERTLPRGGGPSSYGAAAERNAIRNDAQLKWLDQIEEAPVTVEDAQSAIQSGMENSIAQKQAGVMGAESTVADALSQLPAPIQAGEAGGLIREGALAGKTALKDQMTTAFQGAGEGLVDVSPVAAVISENLPKYFKEVGAQPNGQLLDLIKGLSREGEVSGVLDASGSPITKPASYTLQDTQALRSEALKIAQGSDKRTASVAGKIADALKLAEDEAVKAGNVSATELASLNEGRRLRKEVGAKFESSATPTKGVLATQSYGEFKLPESAIPSKYFRPGEKGTREAIRNFKETIGSSEQALEPLYRYATDSLRDYAIKGDKVDAGKLRRWLDRHKSALDEMPELREQFNTVEKAQTFLNEKFGDLARTQAEVEKGALRQFVQTDPDAAISQMLSGREMVKRTDSLVQYLKGKDPDAVAGLRRGVIDYLKQKTFQPGVSGSLEEASLAGGPRFDGTVKGELLRKEWLRIKPALEKSKLFTDSQMKAFDYLYKDKTSQLSVEKAKMPGGSDTVQNASTMVSLMRAASSTFLGDRFTSPLAKVITGILRQIPEERFLSTLEQALLDPRMARDLLNKANNKNFIKSAESLFKSDIDKALGAANSIPVIQGEQERKPKPIAKQHTVTSQKSFPTPQELTNPATAGSLKNNTFDAKKFVAGQSRETRARIQQESGGNPWAISPKGAQGLSQLMPETAKEITANLGETYKPLNPQMSPIEQAESIKQNVRYGDLYYQQQFNKYRNRTLAWAAYNAGPGRVDKAIAKAGPGASVEEILRRLPKGVQAETVPYVNNVSEIMARLT